MKSDCTPCCIRRKPTEPALLVLYRKALMYDIRNAGYIEGHLIEEGKECERHMTQDIGEEGNEDRVARVLEFTFAEIKEILQPYTRIPMCGGTVDDMPPLDEDFEECYYAHMDVPATMSQTTLDLIAKAAHEMMVARAVADWLTVTKPEAASRWQEKAIAAERRLTAAKNSRCGRVRRPCHPF